MKKMYFLVMLFMLLSPSVYSEDIDVSKLPKLLGSNAGREFIFSPIPFRLDSGISSDVKLYISSGIRTKVVVEIEAKGYEKIKYTVPNDIIEFDFSAALACSYVKDNDIKPYSDQIWRAIAIHVKGDDPIICYCEFGTHSNCSAGFLAKSVPYLGKEYIISSYPDYSNNQTEYYPGEATITAAYDKTVVSISKTGTDSVETSVYNLNKFDVLLISSSGYGSDITGTKVIASKPVAVVSGNYCAFIPDTSKYCDLISEFEIPTNWWGMEYHVPNIIDKKKNPLIKIFAKEPNTKIYRDSILIATIQKAGGVEGIGFLSMLSDSGTPRPITITGNKLISVTLYSSGYEDDNVISHPAQLILNPIEQYQKEIIFPSHGNQFSLTGYLILSYEATQNGTIPDDFEFAQVFAGQYDWIKIKDISPNPGIPFYKVNNKNYYFKTFVLPGDGVIKIRANEPFGAYVYNKDSYYSELFSTSAALGDLTRVDTFPPVTEWTIECNGQEVNGTLKDMPDNSANRSNLSTVYMHSDLSYNYKMYISNIKNCEDSIASWSLEVIDCTEDAKAVITFADCAGNDTTIEFNYFAVKLEIQPDALLFEDVNKGNPYYKFMEIYNMSDNVTATIKSIKLKHDNQGFAILNSSLEAIKPPLILKPFASQTIIIGITAPDNGRFKDTVIISDSCCYNTRIPVEAYTLGTGVDEKEIYNEIKIIPNPARDKLIISFNRNFALPYQIRITDIIGNIIISEDIIYFENKDKIIDLSGFANGIYFIQIIVGNEIITKKISVIK